ncbi:MAG TPA: adenylate/guanylate cyclase domain-containing protein [Solirubrobacteraceae bacterium]|nr:adenylate/guanylate cyclase domain-containing protein [Solirubrobacteraceae bacterium]
MQRSGEAALDAYVPRGVLRHLATVPDETFQAIAGTMLFLDLSGFTRLSERLQRVGREGAELMAEAINGCFRELLAVAYANGGSLVKFGGDALLLFFEDELHAQRACRSAIGMRRLLRTVGRLQAGPARVDLRMTVGIHSDVYHFFLVGDSHREYVVAGPAATAIVATEAVAASGQIVVSRATAEHLPARCLGAPAGDALLLARSPIDHDHAPVTDRHRPPVAAVAGTLSTAVRAHVAAEATQPEHRTATIAFLHYAGTDAILRDEGAPACAAALDELIGQVQQAADAWEVCFLGSDVDADGGKLILTAGAPRLVGDDEARMLLALRQIIDGRRRLAVRIGVNRGPAFTAEIGPPYRRTFTLMGDTINLAARLMGRAPPGEIYATAGVLERSTARFATRRLEPFMVKGKSRPIEAWAVGGAIRGAGQSAGQRSERLALVGRADELRAIDAAVADAHAGRGRLLEIVGEAGIGKSRLAEELARRSPPVRVVQVACDAYTATLPYAIWHVALRELLGLSGEHPDALVEQLRDRVRRDSPALEPWLPLLAMALNIPSPSTPEVDALGDDARRPKLHAAVLRLLDPLRDRPLRIEIDHAHVMDDASAALLGALVGELGGTACLVVVTRRDVDGGFQAPAHEHVVRLAPGPLSPDELRALADAATEQEPLPPHLVAVAVERSGGSPQLLLDLLDAAARGDTALPESAEAAAMARIDALAVADRSFVRRASVLGVSFRERELAGVLDPAAELPDERRWERLAAILERTGNGQVRFVRGTLREAAYASLPFGTRRRLHAAVAAALQTAAGDGPDADPATLSLHFTLAGDYGPSYRLALVAARRAETLAASADAARMYRRAIEAGRLHGVPPDELAGVWEELGQVLVRVGEPAAAEDAYGSARALVRGDRVREAQLMYRHARVADRTGRTSAAVRWARRALRGIEGLEGDAANACRALLLAELAQVRQRQGRSQEAIRLCGLAMAESERCGEERALAHACFVLDWALAHTGRHDEAVHSVRALEIYERLGEVELRSHVLNNLGGHAYGAGRWDEAVRYYAEAASEAQRAGAVYGAAYADCNIGEVLADQGHREEAERRLRNALRLWRAIGDEEGCTFARFFLGTLEARWGEPASGLQMLREVAGQLRDLGLAAEAALARALAAEAAARDGRFALAQELVSGPGDAHRRVPAVAFRVRAAMAGAEQVGPELEASLAAARAAGYDYDALLALDALCRIARPPDPARERERDDLARRLRVVALPEWSLAVESRPAGPAAARG